MATELVPLDSREKGRLAGYVKTISDGQKTFIEVGNALACIQRERLYRATHKSFEAFCKEHWGYAKSHTYRLIEAAGVSETSPVGDKMQNERQARELAKVPAEQQAAVLEWAEEKAGDKPVTAKIIREAIAEVAEAEPDDDEIPEPEPTTTDRMNAANKVLEAFARSIAGLIAEAEQIDNAHLTDDKNGRLETLKAQLKSAAGTVRSAKGAGVCTYCDGVGCKHCLKTGWLTKTALESAPEKAA